MMTEAQVLELIDSTLFGEFIVRAIDGGLNPLKNAIKKADQDRRSKTQNLQTKLYQVLIDALNQCTYNQYQGKDRLYDSAECILNELIDKKGYTEAIKSGLQIIGAGTTDEGYSEFLQALCNEICKDKNSDLYKGITMLWELQERELIHREFGKNSQAHEITHALLGSVLEKLDSREDSHAAELDEIPVESRSQDYADRWDACVFLNRCDEENGNGDDSTAIRLRELYGDDLLPQYKLKNSDQLRGDLKKRLHDYVVTIDRKKMLLVLGQAGIGKSTLITWIMANLAAKDQIMVYQFASDLEGVNWQKANLLSEVLKALKLTYKEIENKALILDGFDEIHISGEREGVLNKLEQEMTRRNALKHFSLIVTCRENYIYGLKNIRCEHITLQPWSEGQIETFCKRYWGKCRQTVVTDKIVKIQEKKEILGIPLILYMILALHVSIKESSSVADIYEQIFSLKGGGIYDRCYDTEHRTNEPKVKKCIHQITQRISFWVFENNDEQAFIYQKNFREICEKVRLEAEDAREDIQSATLIGSYFKIKHCEGILADEVSFVHRSIYEYFVAVYFFESLIGLQTKEEAAGKLGELLKRGLLTHQMLEFIKHKFDSGQRCPWEAVTKDIFNIMLRDGMTYHTETAVWDKASCRTNERYKHIADLEMNIFANMLDIVQLWNTYLGKVDSHIISFLRHNDYNINLFGISLKGAPLYAVNLRQADLSCADLLGTNLAAANLSEADLLGTNLSGSHLSRANLSYTQMTQAKLRGAGLTEANLKYAILYEADLSNANLSNAYLERANLEGANLRNAALYETDLRRAILNSANLEGATLDETDLREASLHETIFDEEQVKMLCDDHDLSDCLVHITNSDEIISYQEYLVSRKDEGRK